MHKDLLRYANKSDCRCGKPHHVSLESILTGPGVLRQGLEPLLTENGSSSVTVIGDDNTLAVTAEPLQSLFSEYDKEIVIRSLGDEVIHCDQFLLGKLLTMVPPECDLLIAAGSGTITDSSRYVAHRLGIPLISLPTAPSMDGYASSIAPTIIEGIKVSLPATIPRSIIADTSIFATAPARMTASGYGDLLGKFIANMDWRLAHTLHDEYFCEYTSSLVLSALQECLHSASGRSKAEVMQDAELLEMLMNGLIISGLAISMLGYSRAASGSEHVISHFMEFKNSTGKLDHFFHGETVALGTWIMENIYTYFLSLDPEELSRRSEGAAEEFSYDKRASILRDEYGEYAAPILEKWKNNPPTPEYSRTIREQIQNVWQELQDQASSLLPGPPELATHFEKTGVPYRPQHFGLGKAAVKNSILCAKEMRGRYNIMRLLDEMFLLEHCIDAVLDAL